MFRGLSFSLSRDHPKPERHHSRNKSHHQHHKRAASEVVPKKEPAPRSQPFSGVSQVSGNHVDEKREPATIPEKKKYPEDKFLLPLPEITPLLDTESMFSSLSTATSDQPTGAPSSSAIPAPALPTSAPRAPVPGDSSAPDLSFSSPSTTVEGEHFFTPSTSPVHETPPQLSNSPKKDAMSQHNPPKESTGSSLASRTDRSRKRKSDSSRSKPSQQTGDIETAPIRVVSPPPIAKLSLLQPRDHNYTYKHGNTAMKTGKNPGLRIDPSAETSRKVSINEDPSLLPPLTANSIAASTPGSPAFQSSVYSLSFTNNTSVRPRTSSSHKSSPGLFTASPGGVVNKKDADPDDSDHSSPLVSELGTPEPDAQSTDDNDDSSESDTCSLAATQSNAPSNGALNSAEALAKHARAKSRNFFSNLKSSNKNSSKSDDNSSNIFRRNRRVSLAEERNRSSTFVTTARSVVSDYPAMPDKGNDSVIGSVDNSSMTQGMGTMSRRPRARFHNFKLSRTHSLRESPQETSPEQNQYVPGRESKVVIRNALPSPSRPKVSNTWKSNHTPQPASAGFASQRKPSQHHYADLNRADRESPDAQLSLDEVLMGSRIDDNIDYGAQYPRDISPITVSHPLNRNKPSAITNSMAHLRHGAGKAKGLLGRMRAGNTSDRLAESQRLYDNENIAFNVINLPLVEQTRISRVCKDYDDCNSKTEYWMPSLPYRCIDFLNFKGVEEEGLYRVPGSGREVKRWQRRFDTELDINLLDEPELYDVNAIGSMFKAWLRELPDDLLPHDVQERIVNECTGAKTAPQLLRDELSKLPPYNYYLLFAITSHLHHLVHYNVEQNKMNYNNLCICFKPCLRIDPLCFWFLVCDWANCWQGCWAEKEYRTTEQETESQEKTKRSEEERAKGAASPQSADIPRTVPRKSTPSDSQTNSAGRSSFRHRARHSIFFPANFSTPSQQPSTASSPYVASPSPSLGHSHSKSAASAPGSISGRSKRNPSARMTIHRSREPSDSSGTAPLSSSISMTSNPPDTDVQRLSKTESSASSRTLKRNSRSTSHIPNLSLPTDHYRIPTS